MLMKTMPEVLTWQAGSDVMIRVFTGYLDLLSQRLGELLGELRSTDPALGEELQSALGEASDDAFTRVIAAPETSHRLVWRPSTAARHGRFILAALRAEQAREGRSIAFTEETWTAVGDIGFFADQRVEYQPRLENFPLVLDFGSPHARRVDLGDGDTTSPRESFTAEETARILGLLQTACDGIDRVDPLIAEFSLRFNRVLVLQKDAAEPDNFTSGSTGQFVGRSFLTNPHLDVVHEVGMAEGIVHEAIHALLYMQEQTKPWVLREELYHPTQSVISPWTGSSLALRPFLQACFVWYGLLNFWCAAFVAGEFDKQKVQARIQVSLAGFVDDAIERRLEPWVEGIDAEVLEAIDGVHRQVKRTLLGVQ